MKRFIFVLFFIWLVVGLCSQSYAQEILSPPTNDLISFDNPNWQISNPAAITHITSPFNGIRMDCTANQDSQSVLILDLPNIYQGNVNFEFREDTTTSSALNYFFSVRDMIGTLINNSLDIGTQSTRVDYNNVLIKPNHFFYSTRLDSTNTKMIPIDTYAQRINDKNFSNLINFVVSPAGGVGKINRINLGYLPSNKDAVGVTEDNKFYPTSATFTKFNRIVIACPWKILNTLQSGALLIKNPTVDPIVTEPTDRKETLKILARKLLEKMPTLPTGDASEIPPAAYIDQSCDIPAGTTMEAYYKSQIDSVNPRIKVYKAMAYAYLYPKSDENYQNIINNLFQNVNSLNNDKGFVVADVAITYRLALKKYPEKYTELSNLMGTKLTDAVNSWSKIPESRFLARSGGDMNTYRSAANISVGRLTNNQNMIDVGNCFLFHSATKNTNERPNPTIPSCNFSTKNVYNGSEAIDPVFISAGNILNIGIPYDGRYENHNYATNPTYLFGSNLGEIAVASLFEGINQTNVFTPYINHSMLNLWFQNQFLIDYENNLWNSSSITLISPKDQTINVSPADPPYDSRLFCADKASGYKNLFKEYSKSENFVDPADSIYGLMIGSIWQKNFTDIDKLIKHIWYLADDYSIIPIDETYGISPYDKPLNNIHPGFYEQSAVNAFRSMILPTINIERYVLAAMLIDQDLDLTNNNPLPSPSLSLCSAPIAPSCISECMTVNGVNNGYYNATCTWPNDPGNTYKSQYSFNDQFTSSQDIIGNSPQIAGSFVGDYPFYSRVRVETSTSCLAPGPYSNVSTFTQSCPIPSPSPSFNITNLIDLLKNYLSTIDSGYLLNDNKVNMLDAAWVIKWLVH